MAKSIIATLAAVALFATKLAAASPSGSYFQQPGAAFSGQKTVTSSVNPNITITFKTPDPGTCTTTFSGQKQYTGYVSIPPFTLAPIQQDYTINTFFWFVEARSSPETAPLTLWMNGGPGSSSMIGMFQENGPCEVVEIDRENLGTKAREWGWDRSSNMIWIDQPNQVGYSFDSPTDGSLNLLDVKNPGPVIPPEPQPSGALPNTFLRGTFPSGNPNATANTTDIAAHATWHMLQGFLSAFPQYNPGTRPSSGDTQAAGIHFFTESYGGKYGPAFATFWEDQNARRENGSLPRNTTIEIKLETLGIVNGCIDDLVAAPYYPIFAVNNTYGIKSISDTEAQMMLESFSRPGGCADKYRHCRTLIGAMDPANEGDVAAVNDACTAAAVDFQTNVIGPPLNISGRAPYDWAHLIPDPTPGTQYLEYLNRGAVREAIGSPINYTESNIIVNTAFGKTGDWSRGGQLDDLGSLLDQGVKVAMIYGDRDYICNWMGGEATSLAVVFSGADKFKAAGYQDVQVNESYVGGQVRQYGNFSFSRVYQAGHEVPFYQPETALTLFTRAITGKNIATGQDADLDTFATSGSANSTKAMTAPKSPSPTCYLRDVSDKCTPDQLTMIQKGEGVIINGILYASENDWEAPQGSATSGVGQPGEPASQSSAPAGTGAAASATSVYVASAATTTAKKSSASKGCGQTKRKYIMLMVTVVTYFAIAFSCYELA